MKKIFSLLAVALFAVAATLVGCNDKPTATVAIEKLAKYADANAEIILYASLDVSHIEPFAGLIKDIVGDEIYTTYASMMPMVTLTTNEKGGTLYTATIVDLEAFKNRLPDEIEAELFSVDGVNVLAVSDSDAGIRVEVANPDPNIFIIAYDNVTEYMASLEGLNSKSTARLKKLAETNNVVIFEPNSVNQIVAAIQDSGDIDLQVRSVDINKEEADAMLAQAFMFIVAVADGKISAEEISKMQQDISVSEMKDITTINASIGAEFIKKLVALAVEHSEELL